MSTKLPAPVRLWISTIAFVLFAVAGCRPVASDPLPVVSDVSPDPVRTYRFGIPLPGSSRALWARYGPLVDQVNAEVHGFAIRLESAQSPETYESKFRNGSFDLVLVEPHLVLDAEERGYRIFALTGREDRIGGVIVTLRGSGINRAQHVRRKTICLPPANVLASSMLIRMWLHEAGIDPDRAARIVYASSDSGALLNLCKGDADLAGVSLDGWKRFTADNPEQAEQLNIRWRTDMLSGPALMAGSSVLNEDLGEIQSAFAALASTGAGRAALAACGYSRFRPAGSASYDDVWEFVTEYRRIFRTRLEGLR